MLSQFSQHNKSFLNNSASSNSEPTCSLAQQPHWQPPQGVDAPQGAGASRGADTSQGTDAPQGVDAQRNPCPINWQ
jgi:hypothetical protein